MHNEQQAAPRRLSITPTDTEYVPRKNRQSVDRNLLTAAPFSYANEEDYVRTSVESISTKLRCAVKEAIEKGLNSEFQKLGGECLVYFCPVKTPDMGVDTFLREIQVVWFPDWFSEYIPDDGGYLSGKFGWLLIEMGDNGDGMIGGLAYANMDFSQNLYHISEIIHTVSNELIHNYNSWVLAEYRSFDVVDAPPAIPSPNTLHLAFDSMLEDIHLIPERIKALIAAENHVVSQQLN